MPKVDVSMKRPSAAPTTAFAHGIRLDADRKRSASQGTNADVKRQKTSSTLSGPSGSPFEDYPHPTPSDIVKLHTVLAKHFKERRPDSGKMSKGPILDTVVGVILSQNTTNVNSARAFQQLIGKFRTWDAVRKAKPAAVEAEIKCGGLASKKTQWIQHVLTTIHKETGKTSMEHLRKKTKNEVHAELCRFPGIGKKTAAIINLFDVGHPDMAVDTHVFRYALQLGWAPTDEERTSHNEKKSGKRWPVVTRDTVYEHLDSRFPDTLKYSMHLMLTDTEGGLPTVCGANKKLGFDGHRITVDGLPLEE